RALAEGGREAELSGERRLDHLLLHLAVERKVDLLAGVVLTDVDERVLLGEQGQRRPERGLVLATVGHDGRLQRRRGEVCRRARTRRLAGPGGRAGGGERVGDP